MVRRLLRRLPWDRISLGLLVLSTLVFALRLPDLADGDWSRLAVSFGHHGWLLGWMLVISFLARGRGLRHVLSAFLGGFFTSIWLAVTLGDLSAARLGAHDPWQLVVAVPVIEELAKLVPLLVVVLLWRRRLMRSLAIVDLTLLGTAVGAGFAIHEDALWQRLSGSGLDGTLGWIAPSFHSDVGLVVGHAGWTGLVGLGLGVWLKNRHRRWTRLVPVVLLALAIADHALWNDPRVREHWRPLLLDGWLPAAVFLAGIVLAAIADSIVVHRHLEGRSARLARRLPGGILRTRNPLVARRRLAESLGLLRINAQVAHGRAHRRAVVRRAAVTLAEAVATP